jgi:hypothetical protein
MNELQLNYLNLKNQYDALEKAEQWDELEEMEDQFLDAESNLVNWAIDETMKAGMKKEDAEFLKRNWTQNPEKVIKLALALKVA